MNVNAYISSLVQYALDKGLIENCDRIYATNQLLQVMQLDSFEPAEGLELPLEEILQLVYQSTPRLRFCELFTDDSGLWNNSSHSHPYLELVYYINGKCKVKLPGDADNFLIVCAGGPPGPAGEYQQQQVAVFRRADNGTGMLH